MTTLPIRARLTFWYFCILAAGLLAFAFFTLAMLDHAIHRTADGRLRAHMAAVRQIMGEDANRDPAALRHDLDEDVELAPDLTLLQIWTENGDVVYRSAAMNRMQVPDSIPRVLRHPATRAYRKHDLRVLVRNVSTRDANYVVMVAVPIRDFVEASRQIQSALWIAIPLLLLIAGAGGYWIAGRALSPILGMIEAADAIQPNDLSTRLHVPPARDELQRLSLTLNVMLDRLQSGFERITRFTADASHELRTPVALLRTRTEVLLRRPRSAEEYRAAHEENLQELERTSNLIEQLMLLTRADAGAETLNFTKVDLTELVRSTAAMTQPLAEAKDIAWSVDVPPETVRTYADENALRRLLLVLIDNAVKYTPRNGSVTIALENSGGSAMLAIRDTGIGIAEHALPNIFDRFYRADQARERTTGGAGLGLSIGQWIAQRHGAEIGVESVLAQGSTFTVQFRSLEE
jgi:heavy metal sensor kinase